MFPKKSKKNTAFQPKPKTSKSKNIFKTSKSWSAPSTIGNQKFFQGYYTIIHPEKCKNSTPKVIYRSGLEMNIMRKLDQLAHIPNLIYWGIECFPSENKNYIWYKVNNLDGSITNHKYHLDFEIAYIDPITREKNIALIEMKDKTSINNYLDMLQRGGIKPIHGNQTMKSYTYYVTNLIKNSAKWNAMKKIVKDKSNISFYVLDEDTLKNNGIENMILNGIKLISKI